MSTVEINATAASLLGFLHAGPMTGWDLDRTVATTISNFWNVTRSQVYRELRTLADLNLVEAGDAGPRERRPYTITQAGREAFARWIALDPGPAIIRFPFLLTIFFAEHIPADRLAQIVDKEKEYHVQALQHFRTLQEVYWDRAPWVAEVVRFAIGYQQHILNWLDGLPIARSGPDPEDARGYKATSTRNAKGVGGP
jgi:DNA-binding PadR family transcriptional regulator